MNPFIINGYHSPSYFCNRKKELEAFVNAINNNRHVTLFSVRKMGKTGLINHLFHHLKKDDNISMFYFDIMPCRSLAEFTNSLGTSIIGKLDPKPMQIIKNAGKLFSYLRPQINFDTLSGLPSVSFNSQNENETKQTLTELFKYLQKQSIKKKIVIAIDEFQQIRLFKENNVEAFLRSHIQQLNNVVFIYSGSQKHLLLSMFGDARYPFYNSTELMHLDKINKDDYCNFIKKKFNDNKITIQDEQIHYILDWTFQRTFNVQFVCNKLYGLGISKIYRSHINKIFFEILKENESLFYSLRNILSAQQWKLLKAIASEQGAKSLYSNEFINKHKLGAASTVKRSIDALLNKEMIFEENGKYFVYDVFLSRWLENN